jgi:ubiquinone/menaquinone biosynthesis C-methylase UbiE
MAKAIGADGHVIAGDFSWRMIAFASEHARRKGLEIDFVHVDAEALPFQEARFDVVT